MKFSNFTRGFAVAAATISIGSPALAATLFTSPLNMGLGSLICRVTNTTVPPMTGVDIIVEDGNGVTIASSVATTVPGGSTVGVTSPSGVGVARCIFRNVSKSRVRANGTLNNGNLAADGVVVEAR